MSILDYIIKPLVHIFNLCFETGTFPKSIKGPTYIDHAPSYICDMIKIYKLGKPLRSGIENLIIQYLRQ